MSSAPQGAFNPPDETQLPSRRGEQLRLPWLGWISHVVALIVGWLCADGWMDYQAAKIDSDHSIVRLRSAQRIRSSTGRAAANALLARWTRNAADPAILERLQNESAAEIANSVFEELADIDAENIMALLASGKSGKFNFMLNQMRELLLAEPAEMRNWFESLSWDKQQKFAFILFDERLASAIPDEQIDSWEGICSQRDWLSNERGRRAGKRGDLVSLAKTLEEIAARPGDRYTSASLGETIANWPTDRVYDLAGKLDAVLNRCHHGIARLLARLPSDQRMTILESLIANGGRQLQRAALDDLRPSVALSATGMDLEERLSMTRIFHSGDVDKYIPRLIARDVAALLSDGQVPDGASLRDSLDRVRKGEMTTDELLKTVSARLGSLAEGREELIRSEVFLQVARSAPDAAGELAERMPAKSVQELSFSLGLDAAGIESAATILRMREPEAPGDLNSRFSEWGHKSFEGLARYGDAYVAWALAMPQSLERDLVLSSIAVHLEKDDPQWAARLRAEKTYQSGWKPGIK